MKVLISSKQLARELSVIDFDLDRVVEVGAENNELIIDTQEKVIRIDCVISGQKLIISQSDNRWDWLNELVNIIPEQPIVLLIYENKLIFTVNY